MDYDNLDEETIAQRKKDQIEFRNKKKFSTFFTILSSLFEIIETIIIMFAMFLLTAFIMFKVCGMTGDEGQKIYSIMLVVIFFAGLVIGFIIYKKLVRLVIKKFNLKGKLLEEILTHYFTDQELAAL